MESELIENLDTLYRLAYTLLRNRHEAEDCVSETLLKALKAKEQFQSGTNVRSWATTILLNTIRDVWKRKHGVSPPEENSDFFETRSEETAQNLLETPQDFLSSLAENSLKGKSPWPSFFSDELFHALNRLPLPFRELFLVYVLFDFSYEELSRLFHLPLGTVMSRLNRTRNVMREELKIYARQHGWNQDKSQEGVSP